MTEPKTEYRFTPPEPEKHMRLTLAQYDKLLAEAKGQEREQCCKDVCFMCRRGMDVLQYGLGFHHRNGKELEVCFALQIRQRAAKEQ